MSKNLNKYTNQAFVLRAHIYEFERKDLFNAYWYGKGPRSWYEAQDIINNSEAGHDFSKKKNRFSKLVGGDEILAKVIIFPSGSDYYYPVFNVCSATIIKSSN